MGLNMSSFTLKITGSLIILAFLVTGLVVIDTMHLTVPSSTTYSPEATMLPSVRILAPYGQSTWGPYRDGVVIVGSNYFSVHVFIDYSEDAVDTIKNVKIWLDTQGDPEPGYNVTFVLSGKAVATAIVKHIDGSVSEYNATSTTRYILLEIPEIAPGDKIDISYRVNMPAESQVPKLPYTITLKEQIQFGSDVAPQIYEKPIQIIDRPIMNLIIIWILALGTFAGVIILGYLGFFRLYTSMDLVSMGMVGALMVVWVQILGRQLIFPLVDRIPMSHNFAVADFPYVLLLVTAIALVRKPGAASLTLFVYNIVSEIGWYGLNFLWWAYPFAQGIPVDFYLLIRGKGVLTDKNTFFRFRLSEEELESVGSIPFLKYFDGFMIGLLRGFFMQVSLYTVFYPNLFRVEYFWEYVFWWHVIPWTIGNAIGAAIAVPIVEKIEEAITY